MKTVEERLKEAEATVASIRKEMEEAEKVKPVFPTDTSCEGVLGGNGVSFDTRAFDEWEMCAYANQGNSFYSTSESDSEAKRRKAETRVKEKINEANQGDNGYKISGDNYYLYYDFRCKSVEVYREHKTQSGFGWEYFREDAPLDKLLKDKGFIKDWMIMKGMK